MTTAGRSKSEVVMEVRTLLQEAFRLRFEGGLHARAAHAQGLVDGYMRGVLDGGVLSQKELLAIVADERRALAGPSLRVLTPSAA